MGKPLDSPASFRSISLTYCVSKLLERIILSLLLFFLESNSVLSPRQAGFCPGRSTLDQILFLSQSISDGFNKPRPGSQTILSTIDFSKALALSGIPPFSTNLFRLASLLALLVGLNLSFLIGTLVWSIKITKVVPFEFVEVFHKDPFSAMYFSLSSLMIFRDLCLLPSAALFFHLVPFVFYIRNLFHVFDIFASFSSIKLRHPSLLLKCLPPRSFLSFFSF